MAKSTSAYVDSNAYNYQRKPDVSRAHTASKNNNGVSRAFTWKNMTSKKKFCNCRLSQEMLPKIGLLTLVTRKLTSHDHYLQKFLQHMYDCFLKCSVFRHVVTSYLSNVCGVLVGSRLLSLSSQASFLPRMWIFIRRENWMVQLSSKGSAKVMDHKS